MRMFDKLVANLQSHGKCVDFSKKKRKRKKRKVMRIVAVYHVDCTLGTFDQDYSIIVTFRLIEFDGSRRI